MGILLIALECGLELGLELGLGMLGPWAALLTPALLQLGVLTWSVMKMMGPVSWAEMLLCGVVVTCY